jgi:hypothetical protein
MTTKKLLKNIDKYTKKTQSKKKLTILISEENYNALKELNLNASVLIDDILTELISELTDKTTTDSIDNNTNDNTTNNTQQAQQNQWS